MRDGRETSTVRRSEGRSLDWEQAGQDWPLHEASRFIEAGGVRWHVQIAGQGPVLLLVHGTGASTHSWRDLVPLLAGRFTVIAPDLPGHAFTSTPPQARMTLPAMGASLGSLLQALGLSPRLVVGHSAGAAILAEMCLDDVIDPAGLVSLNGALLPIGGLAGQIFSPLAKLMASGPSLARLFAWWASDEAVVERLISQTGSTITPAGLALYRRLARDPGHAAGALAMMANWDLGGLQSRLSRLRTPLLLVAGSRDRSIPPTDASRVAALAKHARVHIARGLGHLAHEERPTQIVQLIEEWAERWHVLETPVSTSSSSPV